MRRKETEPIVPLNKDEIMTGMTRRQEGIECTIANTKTGAIRAVIIPTQQENRDQRPGCVPGFLLAIIRALPGVDPAGQEAIDDMEQNLSNR